MPMPPTKPFGRRGRIDAPAARRPPSTSPVRQAAALPSDSVPNLPPEIVAAVLYGSGDLRDAAFAGRARITRVGWSWRAAVLAGLIVGLVNAAARATTFLSFGSLGGLDKLPLGQTLLGQTSLGQVSLGQISVGEASVPLAVLVALAGLWSGARASALAVFVTHFILVRIGRTSLVAYSLGGAAASLAYALLASLIGEAATPLSIAMEALSGLGAGFFYRLFAATERG